MDKKKLKKDLENKQVIESCAQAFGVVGDETRLKICYLLCNHPELAVSDIAETIGLSLSAVSHSLDKLKSIGVVKRRQEARKVFYSMTQNDISKIVRRSLKTS